MTPYSVAYQRQTGKPVPAGAERLDPLFDKIAADQALPPRGQQAVDAGFTAHSLNDATEAPAIYAYYQWVLHNCLADHPVHELTSQLVGTGVVCANVFQTDLPQPLTLNPWQVEALADYPLATDRAVLIENNGVFIWLHHRHPTWPLIDQSGNDFNRSYKAILRRLTERGLRVTYLGDLDTAGIQIADRVVQMLPDQPVPTLFALQTPDQVLDWLVQFGRPDQQRARAATVQTPWLVEMLESIQTLHKFVEQEQLIAAYERLITDWLRVK